MNKKEIARGLIKLANTLDNMNLIVEANIVDRVAKKIVVSANPEYPSMNEDVARRKMPTGDYTSDIITYKSLIYSTYYDKDGKYTKHGIEPYKTFACNFKLRAIQKLKETSAQEAKAFGNQANRIKYDFENDITDINKTIGAKQESLNEFLRLYGIADRYGNLREEIVSRAEFNKKWNEFMNDSRVKQIVDRAGDKITKSLGYTYKILTAKLPYDSD